MAKKGAGSKRKGDGLAPKAKPASAAATGGPSPPPTRGPVVVVEASGAYSSAQRMTRGVGGGKRTTGPGRTEMKSRERVGNKRPRSSSWEAEHQAIWKSVTDLGSEQFTGRLKRMHDQKKIEALGGRKAKMQKVPYKMLQGMKAKQKMRSAQQEDEEKESGIVTGHNKSRKSKAGSASTREGDVYSPGRMRDGVLHLSNKSFSARKR